MTDNAFKRLTNKQSEQFRIVDKSNAFDIPGGDTSNDHPHPIRAEKSL